MKALDKRKFPLEADAVAHIAKKYGIAKSEVELRKPHRTRWMFDIVRQVAKKAPELKPWPQFVKDLAEQNGLTYSEALKAASPVYKALKESQAEDVLEQIVDAVQQKEEAVRPDNYPELV